MQEGTTPIPSSCITVPESFNPVVSQPVQNVVFKRKFRWTFEAEFPFGKIPLAFVKVAARPNFNIEETEINFLNAKFPIPGTQTWQEMGITYMAVNEKDNKEFFEVLGKMYELWDLSKADINKPVEPKDEYLGKGTLKLLDGCGQEIEEWELQDMWFTSINFGELDYSSSGETDMEVRVRYKSVKYKSVNVLAASTGQAEVSTSACCPHCGKDLPKPVSGKMGLGMLGGSNIYFD